MDSAAHVSRRGADEPSVKSPRGRAVTPAPWRGRVALLTLALALVGLAAARPDPSSTPEAPGDWPDPTVLAVGDLFVTYATNIRVDGTRLNVPVRISHDLVHWDDPVDALPTLGAWAHPGATWAPGVAPTSDGYVLYYSARHATARGPGGEPVQCIGAAVSPSPVGPFGDDHAEPLVCQAELGGSIDADPFTDTDGRRYLLWKADENSLGNRSRIFAAPLTDDGLALAGTPVVLLMQDRLWERPLVENPSMVRDGGRLTLFYAANRWKSPSYATGYARCTTPLGPCGKATTSGPWAAASSDESGAGGGDVVTDAHGNHWFAYHAWEAGRESYADGGRRALAVRPLWFDDGQPVLGPRLGTGVAARHGRALARPLRAS
jgi:beta-xylosidase